MTHFHRETTGNSTIDFRPPLLETDGAVTLADLRRAAQLLEEHRGYTAIRLALARRSETEVERGVNSTVATERLTAMTRLTQTLLAAILDPHEECEPLQDQSGTLHLLLELTQCYGEAATFLLNEKESWGAPLKEFSPYQSMRLSPHNWVPSPQ